MTPVKAINERVWRASYYLTRRCDLDCWYCCVPGVDADRRTELNAGGVTAVVRNLARMGADLIVFTGGEPFLRPELLLPALRAAKDHGIYPVLLTNGRIAAETEHGRKALRDLVRGIGDFGLSVSMDSAAAAARQPQPRDEGSDQKSFYGLRALEFGRSLGLTDLTATCILDDADPQPCLVAVQHVRERDYGILINLVQRAGETVGNTTFRAARTLPHPMLASVAATLGMHREEWGIKNTPEFFRNIVDGTYATWACTEPGLIVVQPDGQVHLCNNVRGRLLPSLNLATTQARDLTALYAQAWHDDLKTSCPGCYLSCHVDFQYRHKEAR